MTRPERTGKRSLDFSLWIRKNLRGSAQGLVLQDLDWIMLNYRTGLFLLLEVKTHSTGNARLAPAQVIILRMLDDFLRKASDLNAQSPFSLNPASRVRYRYLGIHLLEFSGTDPDNSETLWLDRSKLAHAELPVLLNLEDEAGILALLTRTDQGWLDREFQRVASRLHA